MSQPRTSLLILTLSPALSPGDNDLSELMKVPVRAKSTELYHAETIKQGYAHVLEIQRAVNEFCKAARQEIQRTM